MADPIPHTPPDPPAAPEVLPLAAPAAPAAPDTVPLAPPSPASAPDVIDLTLPPGVPALATIYGSGDVLRIDPETKLLIVFDSSGSMDVTLAPLVEMRDTLLRDLLLPYYGGSDALYDSQVTVVSRSSEYTWNWLHNVDLPGYSFAARQIILIFQDEAQPGYHNNSVPTTFAETGIGQMANLRNWLEAQGRTSADYRGVIFHVASGFSAEPAFRDMLVRTLSGPLPLTTSFPSSAYDDAKALGLTDYVADGLIGGVLDIANGAEPAYYADVIRGALSAMGVDIPPPGAVPWPHQGEPAAPGTIALAAPEPAAAPEAVPLSAAAAPAAPDVVPAPAAAPPPAPHVVPAPDATPPPAPDSVPNAPLAPAPAPSAILQEAVEPASTDSVPWAAPEAPEAPAPMPSGPTDSPPPPLAVPMLTDWLLATGVWNNQGRWNDAAQWPAA